MDRPLGASWVECVAFFVAMFVMGVVAVRLTPPGASVAAWWPGAGVAAAIVIRRWGSRWTLAAVLGAAIVAANVVGGRGWPVSIGFSVANVVELLTTAGCLWRLNSGPPRLESVNEVGRLVAAALAGGAALIVTVGATIAVFGEGPVLPVAVAAAASHVAATMIVVPLVLTGPRVPPRRRLEVLACWAATLAATAMVFGPSHGRPLMFVIIAPLAWCAARLGTRSTCAQLIVVCVMATAGTVYGAGAGPVATVLTGVGSRVVVQALIVTFAAVTIPLAVITANLEAALERERRDGTLLRLGFHEALIGLLLVEVNESGVWVVEANPEARRKLDVDDGDLVHDLWNDEECSLATVLSGLAPGQGWRGEMTYSPLDGAPRRYAVAASRLSSAAGAHLTTCQMIDVTGRQRAQLELEHAALHDPLTGLPNRVLLERLILEVLEHDRPLSLLFVDLDGFKRINDTAGHHVGDRILAEVGRRLAATVRAGDTAARVGGDEFVMVCRDVPDDADRLAVASRVRDAVAEPILAAGTTYQLNLSIGVAASRPGVTVQQLMRQADLALYSAKTSGKGQAQLYTDELGAAADEEFALETALRDALSNGELVVHMQPIIDLDTGAWVAAEALLRWHHPVRGLLFPGAFLPVAERTGMMTEIGAWVLDESCRQAANWTRLIGDQAPVVHVNVSARQLDEPGLCDAVLSTLQRHHLTPHGLVLEPTETQLSEISGTTGPS